MQEETIEKDEQHIEIMNRVQTIKWACLLGNRLCRNLTTESLAEIDSLSPDLREEVVCAGFRGASPELMKQYLDHLDEIKDKTINESLGCCENKQNLNL